MAFRRRYLEADIEQDLHAKMAFVGGPRQVGKTTMSLSVASHNKPFVYLSWDHRPDRETILNERWPPETRLTILDEVHKYHRWKNFVKGIWDTRTPGNKIIVTGSSRLDIFRRGGDSLLGRYQYFRLD